MRTNNAQSIVEMLSTYSWALLVVSIFIAIVIMLSGSPGGTPESPTVCTIQPLFPCLDSTFGAASHNLIPFYLTFINNLRTPIYFQGANSFNLTTTDIGTVATESTLGTCMPDFAPPGTQVVCNANVVGPIEPAYGTNVNLLFTFTYEICSKNAQSSCAPGLYVTSGYATLSWSTANTADLP